MLIALDSASNVANKKVGVESNKGPTGTGIHTHVEFRNGNNPGGFGNENTVLEALDPQLFALFVF